ncbi:cell filamentation protein Fic [Lactococcus cremoris]|uniref:protein adenylyltransferase n=1 Tax=Lactococcus lactis subsp. cremoris TaxID=1359 RepID=A0AA34TH66_LACLC|nr:Fic family protein [Lactococcus cremoris]ARE22322.1 Fic family protein [Lactococcus cremoris]KZK50581.1 cell filamentation protein [Lactococcus cremoris]MCT4421263.1 cell filamentation protein Fic [Lactococcus cremoris]MCT4426749.1 cell filamentation protein Fic [Lactococcus cremoris]MDM7653244.1 Fic family protein [Lactococcus cremoris]
MPRKIYDSYEYIDPDNQYTCEKSSVLVNKQGITDEQGAARSEHLFATQRLLDLRLKPIEIKTVKDILKVHGYIFQDVYDWAGQYRKVNISKQGNAFMAMQAFDTAETYMNSLLDDFHKKAKSREQIIQHLAKILDNENYFHPFREGNGRTQREVIRSLALSKKYKAQIRVEADDEVYNLYMDGTVHGDILKLEKLFDKILEKISE